MKQTVIRTTESLCPRCLKKIPAELVEEDGEIKIKKNCSEHGNFEDTYWGNAGHYSRVMGFLGNGNGVENPRTNRTRGCPYDCGLCNEHKSHTVLGIVDVTNRCNLRCPVCFASAGDRRTYEPSTQQIEGMLKNLRDNKPVPAYAFQFSGGEPTLRDDLPELVKIGRKLGFLYIMVDTNGIRIADDIEYLKSLKNAGLDSFYLQFDGLDNRIYRKLRGVDLLDKKITAIENCRRIGLKNIALVVTLAKGINDNQVGGIIKFAAENSDIIKCVNFQPLSFTGKASSIEVKENRITIYDFINLVENQTKGMIKAEYFYPVPSMMHLSNFVEAYTGIPTVKMSCHPCCGLGTYVVINDDKTYTPITELVEVDRFFKILKEGAEELKNENAISKRLNVGRLKIHAKLLGEIMGSIHNPRYRNIILQLLKSGTYNATASFHENALMVGCMHFMDPWNFDTQRVERCTIHYSTPDGRIIPFCSYNTLHRERVEKEFSCTTV